MLRRRGELDIEVFVGQEEKVPVRIIALPLKIKLQIKGTGKQIIIEINAVNQAKRIYTFGAGKYL